MQKTSQTASCLRQLRNLSRQRSFENQIQTFEEEREGSEGEEIKNQNTINKKQELRSKN
jgi:hypothetical protein